MDAGKAIALLACQNIKPEELFSGRYNETVLPVACVPTTSGTGSEVTQYSILTNNASETKMSIASPFLFPRISFLDARYTLDLPHSITINTAIDALSHAVEGMLSVRANELTVSLARESIGCLAKNFGSLKEGNLGFEEREQLLYGSMLAGMVIAHTGTTAVHSMGYSLTYFKGLDHGRANGLLLCAFLDFAARQNKTVVQSILDPMGFTKVSELKDTIDSLLGDKDAISAEELERFSSIAIRAKNITNSIVVPDRQDLKDFYRKSFKILN